MLAPVVVKVGSFNYEVTLLKAIQANQWRIKLAKIASPLLRELGASVEGGTGLQESSISLVKGFAGGIASIIELLPENDTTVVDLLGLATVRKGKGEDMQLTTDGVDIHFGQGSNQAPLDDMYLLAWEVIKANGFLPKVPTGLLNVLSSKATS